MRACVGVGWGAYTKGAGGQTGAPADVGREIGGTGEFLIDI